MTLSATKWMFHQDVLVDLYFTLTIQFVCFFKTMWNKIFWSAILLTNIVERIFLNPFRKPAKKILKSLPMHNRGMVWSRNNQRAGIPRSDLEMLYISEKFWKFKAIWASDCIINSSSNCSLLYPPTLYNLSCKCLTKKYRGLVWTQSVITLFFIFHWFYFQRRIRSI